MVLTSGAVLVRYKVIGARWKEVSAEDKARFEAMAAKDKERAQTEMKAYKAKLAAEAAGGEAAGGDDADAAMEDAGEAEAAGEDSD
jgi:structure-specific recognition protein 1